MSRRRYRRRPKSAKSLAKRALAKVSKLEKSVEWKYLDISKTGTIGAVPSITLITNIDTGHTKNDREGDEVILRLYYGRGEITQHASDVTSKIRVLIVLDKQSKDPTANVLYEDIIDTNVGTNIYQFRNLDNKHRIVILHDEVIELNDVQNKSPRFSIFKKFNTKVLFNNGTVADGRISNNLYFIVVGDENTNTPTLVSNHCIRYTDG